MFSVPCRRMSVLDTLIKVLRATSIVLIKEFDIFIIFDLRFFAFVVETPIPKANNLKVTIGAAELVS